MWQITSKFNGPFYTHKVMSAATEERQIPSKLFNLKLSPLEISISQKKAGSGLKVFKYTQIDKKWNVYLYKEDLKIAPLLSRTLWYKNDCKPLSSIQRDRNCMGRGIEIHWVSESYVQGTVCLNHKNERTRILPSKSSRYWGDKHTIKW